MYHDPGALVDRVQRISMHHKDRRTNLELVEVCTKKFRVSNGQFHFLNTPPNTVELPKRRRKWKIRRRTATRVGDTATLQRCTSNTMLVWRGDRLLMILSTVGFARCYLSPRIGSPFAQNVRSTQHRLYKRARSTGTRSTNAIVGPRDRSAEQDPDADEWDTWEFGSWKVSLILCCHDTVALWLCPCESG